MGMQGWSVSMTKHYTIDENQLAGTFDDLRRELLRDPDFHLEWTERQAALQLARLAHEMRQEAGLSQAELADRIGVKQSVVARLESRKPRRRYYVTVPTYVMAWARRLLPPPALDRLLDKASDQ